MTWRVATFLALSFLASCGTERLTRSVIARELHISSLGVTCEDAIVAAIADSAQSVIPCRQSAGDRDVQLLKDAEGNVLQFSAVWHADSSSAIAIRDSLLRQLSLLTKSEPRLCTSDDGLTVRVWQLADTEYAALIGGLPSEKVRLILAKGRARCR